MLFVESGILRPPGSARLQVADCTVESQQRPKKSSADGEQHVQNGGMGGPWETLKSPKSMSMQLLTKSIFWKHLQFLFFQEALNFVFCSEDFWDLHVVKSFVMFWSRAPFGSVWQDLWLLKKKSLWKLKLLEE